VNHPFKEVDGSRIGKCTNKTARRARTLVGRSYRISPTSFLPNPEEHQHLAPSAQTTPLNNKFSILNHASPSTRLPHSHIQPHLKRAGNSSRMSIENLKTFDPFAEADEDTGQVKQSQQDYIHIRIQRMSILPQSLVAVGLGLPSRVNLSHRFRPRPRHLMHAAACFRSPTDFCQNAMDVRP
jgi:hypothetical protein